MSSPEPVVVFQTRNESEAKLVEGVLRSSGMRVVSDGGGSGGAPYGQAIAMCRVWVDVADAVEARQIIESFDAEAQQTDDALLTPASDDAPGFENVDFDIWSTADLSPLVDALAPDVIDLNNERDEGEHWVTFEFDSKPASANDAILAFGDLIRRLPPHVRVLWEGASVRHFDIGVSASDRQQSVVLSPEAAALASELGARIVLTLYPDDGENENDGES